MILKRYLPVLSGLFFMLISNPALTQSSGDGDTNSIRSDSKKRVFPLWAEWAEKKGIELPKPFGVSAFTTFMTRDIKVTDVTVQFLDREPESISDFTNFAVSNETYLAAIKVDTWVLPVLNVYLLAGYAYTNSDMNASFTIDRPLLPPVEMEVSATSPVKGPYWGIGTTLVVGYKSWFLLGDANWGKTFPDMLNNAVTFTMLSARTGLAGRMGEKHSIRGWIGTLYMDSECTLEIVEYSELLGDVTVRIDQHPVSPVSYQTGFMITLNNTLEFMTELGTNFKDAGVIVFTTTYRF